MSLIDHQIRAAQRRLWLNLWLARLGWSLLVAAGGWMVLGLVNRLLAVEVPLGLAAAGLTCGALLFSAVWWYVRRQTPADAACALDAAAGLRERLSSSLHCQDHADPWSQAVCADAERFLDRVILRQHVPLRWPASISLALPAMLLALMVVWLTPQADLLGRHARRQEQAARRQQLEHVTTTVQSTIQRVQALSKLDQDAADLNDLKLLAELDPTALQDPQLDPEQLRRQAVKRLQDACDTIKERMASARFEGAQQFRRMMRALNEPERTNDPVSRLRQGLARGDLQLAQQGIEGLRNQLANAQELTAEQRQALQEKLDTLARDLEALAAKDTLAQKLEEMNLSEQDLEKLAEAIEKRDQLTPEQREQLERQLAEKGLTEQQVRQLCENAKKHRQACTCCQGLASSLGQASSSLGEGTGEGNESAASQLELAGEMLSELEAAELEMNDLNAALDELQRCQGGLCRGESDSLEESESGMGRLGRGKGGLAPVEETDVQLRRRKAPVQTGPGSVIAQWLVEGQQLKGQSQLEYNEAANAASAAAAEAINQDRVPRQYQRAVKTYFDRLPAKAPQSSPAEKPSPSAEKKP